MAGVRVYLKNAAILTVTGLGLRAAGMVLRVYMAALLGAEGMGLYQLIFIGEQVLHGENRFAHFLIRKVCKRKIHQNNDQRVARKIYRTGKKQALPHTVNALQFCTPVLSRF